MLVAISGIGTHFPYKPIITTENNNEGVIDLTGNATYGATLEFRAAGNGDINILGAIDDNQASNITLLKIDNPKREHQCRYQKRFYRLYG